eukprot:9059945-Pyramimonas_sp.AAC.1
MFDGQICRVRDDMARHDERTTSVSDQFAELNHRLCHLEKELDLARARPRDAPITSGDMDRPADLYYSPYAWCQRAA